MDVDMAGVADMEAEAAAAEIKDAPKPKIKGRGTIRYQTKGTKAKTTTKDTRIRA